MAERGRGRLKGDGAFFPKGDLTRLDRAIAWFHRRGLPVVEREIAAFLGMNVRTVQRQVVRHGGWDTYVEALLERLDRCDSP